MRFTRLIIGFLVIVVAIAVIASEQLSGASADAVVNARLTTIRAPIAGTLVTQRRPLGSTVNAEEPLGSLQDPLVDNIRLVDLAQEQATAAAEVTRIRESLAALQEAVETASERAVIFRRERLRQLDATARSTASLRDLAETRAEARPTRNSQVRQRSLDLEREDARQRALVADIELEAAQQGIFLGDGYNDAPFSEQRAMDLSLRLSLLQVDLKVAEAKAAALEERISAERRRINRLGSAELVSNVDGRIWEVLAGSGEALQRGQDIVRLIDCDTTMVTLSVSEGVYNRLQMGDSAVFRAASDGRSFAGTITRLAGAGAETVYRNLAIAPSERHLQRYDVALLSPSLREDPELRCAVGRTGRVFFEARPLDFLRRLFD